MQRFQAAYKHGNLIRVNISSPLLRAINSRSISIFHALPYSFAFLPYRHIPRIVYIYTIILRSFNNILIRTTRIEKIINRIEFYSHCTITVSNLFQANLINYPLPRYAVTVIYAHRAISHIVRPTSNVSITIIRHFVSLLYYITNENRYYKAF